MSKTCVLYFSKYCTHCQNLLKILNKTVLKKDIHFLSIDKRVGKNEKTYLLLDDGNEILNSITGEVQIFKLKQGVRFKPLEYLVDYVDEDILEEE